MAEVTPMMKQYLEIREQYKDCILFYRLGDFYELFFDQAELCSRELELTLTGKDCGLDKRAPMCGIPYHAVNTYLAKMVEKGYKVAICEQVEDPKNVKGIVKRDVVKIITPGTITDNTMLDEKKNNYIAAISKVKKDIAFCFCDISTGEFKVTLFSNMDSDIKLINEIARINPSEIIIDENLKQDVSLINYIQKMFDIYVSYSSNKSESILLNRIITGLNLSKLEILCSTILINYIEETQKTSIDQINKIEKYNLDNFMQLDSSTRRNLEIIESNREKTKKGSLLWVLDKTTTAMGGRRLRNWIETPLLDEEKIIKRHNAVDTLINNKMLMDDLKEALKNVYDIERLISKVVNSSANARDLVSLKNSIHKLPEIKNILAEINNNNNCNDKYLESLFNRLDTLDDIYTLIESSIYDDPPISTKEGNVIKSGYDGKVDEYRKASKEGKNWLMELEAKEKELTGIKGKWLRIGYNRVFGYYIEVTNSYKNMIPENRYIRKQTLASAERYITEELKQIEEKILGAEEKLTDLEYEIFCNIRNLVAKEVIKIQKVASVISTLDVLCSFATVAIENGYVKPDIVNSGEIEIIDGRHPVVEKALKDLSFIPNDTFLNNDLDRFLVITGPNMAGKSTYMRQVALITYMAQIGSFVPATSAKISIVDRIFTRIGASDDLAMGESTFMVEMQELSNILSNATSNSLIILDEIGRGTSTYDGLSIAWATAEYIADKEKLGAKTLFATHYHELIDLENKTKGIKNYSVAVKEKGDDVIFLRKIVRGGTDESYGIYVAKLAGVKKPVITRAKQLLKELEDVDLVKKTINEKKKKITTEEIQIDMFNYKMAEMASLLEKINLDELSPKDALDVLYKLKEKIN